MDKAKEGKKKEKRRGHNEGTVTQRQDGRWMAQVTTGYNSEGKIKRVTYYGKTRGEVVEKMDKARMDLKTGTYIEPNKITLGDWVLKWVKIYARQRVCITSYDLYSSIIKLHIVPDIGGIELRKLRPMDIQELYNKKTKSGKAYGGGGLSSETIRRIHNILHSALKQAVKEGLVIRNAADSVEPPKIIRTEVKPLTKTDLNKFMDTVKKDRLYALFALALGTGLRKGEILSTRWSDLDLDKGTVTVQRTLARVYTDEGETKTELIFKEPKTSKSRRTIPIPGFVIAALKSHKAKQNEEKLLLEDKKHHEENNLVFCTPDGKPLEPRNFTKRYAKLLIKAGLAHTPFHNWRHTFATVLLEMGEHPKVVQEMLGHSKIATTLDTYSHIVQGMTEQAAVKMDLFYVNQEAALR